MRTKTLHSWDALSESIVMKSVLAILRVYQAIDNQDSTRKPRRRNDTGDQGTNKNEKEPNQDEPNHSNATLAQPGWAVPNRAEPS